MRPNPSPLRHGCVFPLFLSALWLIPQITRAQVPSTQQVPSAQSDRPPNRSSWTDQPKYKSDQILVRFRPGTSAARVKAIHAANQSEKVRTWTSVEGLQLVRLPAGSAVRDALKTYRSNPDVLYAEPNYVVHALAGPNDPKFPRLWGLQNTGQMGGTAGADIHAAQAWGITTGSANVVVAVIDTGMDYTHEDLSANAWTSSVSFSGNLNGVSVNCPAGSHGYNAVANTCDPMDDNGHGTHVSGTIGAAGNNGVGVAGVNWTVKIMPCKFLDENGSGSTDAAIECLDFVKSMKDQGVNVVATNNSWGGFGFSQALFDAIQAQQQDGILFVAAAGNDSSNNDLGGFYPASFFLPNIISVAATTRFDWLADFSNTGAHSVSLGAPGQEILSTIPNNSYAVLNGTSMAAPHVSGVAALLAAQDGTRDWRAIRNLILAGGDTIPSLAQTVTGRRLDAYGSLTCAGSHVAKRLLPSVDAIVGTSGKPIVLTALNINCAQPAGAVTVTVSPGNQVISLIDGGTAPDQAANDGIYSGQWAPPGLGNYLLTFSTGDTVQVTVLNSYVAGETSYSYQAISGTSMNLGDDEVATLELPFPVRFGGAGFSKVYVSSNGTLSFTNAFDDFINFGIPVNAVENTNPSNPPPPAILQPLVTLIAPYWMDLYPVKGASQNVFWAITGSAPNRQLVIEWRNVRSFACRNDSSTTVTFETIFSESTSNVLFNYANTSFAGDCSAEDNGQAASIGVQVSQDVGLQWGGPSLPLYVPGQLGVSQPTIASGMALQWTLADPHAPPNPAPTVTSVSPASLPAGSPDTWVTVTGSGFVPASQAAVYPLWTRVTKYISATQVQVLLTAEDLASPVFYQGVQINITNPQPGGGTSQAVFVQVTQQTPVITSLSPSSIPAGSFGFNLIITGSGFVPGATNVLFDGNGGDTTLVSSTQLIFAITGAMVATPRTVNVQVQTGVNTFSNIVPFTITPATIPATLQAPQAVNPKGSTSSAAPAKPKLTPDKVIGRFLGWKAGQALGPSYNAKYQRQLSRLAPAVSAGAPANSPTSNLSTSTTSAASPAPAGFALRPDLPSGFIPTAVATGDFNGDGKPDWAVANGGDNTIWIYLGNGDGSAKLPTIIRLEGHAPVALTTADMNGDGKLDLIVAEADSLAVAVLLGNGDGTFGPELTFTVPGYPESLVVRDFDGDGKLDVVVGLAVAQAEIAFMPGDGLGRLGAPVLHYGQSDGLCLTFAIAAADLNGDGLPDIVALDYAIFADGILVTGQMGDAGGRVYLNQGDGSFKLAQQFFHDSSVDQGPQLGQAATAIALADLDGNGCVDAVTLDSLGSATFFPGLCDGTFDTSNTRIFGTGIVATTALLADVNGDGKADLISSAMAFLDDALYASTPSDVVSVLFGDGKGNFASPTLYRGETAMVSLAAADLKKNGRPEIISVNQNSDTITVYQNDGNGGFGSPKGGYIGYLTNGQMHAVGNAPLSNFAVVDLNGDGKPDLAAVESGAQYPLADNIAVLLNNGAGGYGAPLRTDILDVNNDVQDFVFADFRNTGRKDLLIFSFYLANTTQFGPSYGFAKGNGDGTFQKPVWTGLQTSGIFPVRFAVGDCNGDGKLDFLVVSYASVYPGTGTVAGIYPFLGKGDGTFTAGTAITFPSTATYSPYVAQAVVSDVNGDGKADLLILGYQLFSPNEQSAIYELLGNGDGTFQNPKLLFNKLGPFGVVDLNKDGHPDIVAGNDQGTADGIFGHLWAYSVLMGKGDGTFTPGVTYGPYPSNYGAGYFYPPADRPLGAPQPVIGDFNGDGIPDLAVYTTAGTNVFTAYGYAGAALDTQIFVLAGKGDGTFTVPNIGQGMGGLVVPQTAADLNADGRTDLIEMNAYTSAFTNLTATAGPSFAVGLVSDPVIGNNGKLRVILNYPSSSGTTLQLSASDANITLPASVTLGAGATVQDVSFQIGTPFNNGHVFALTAQLGTESHTAYGTQAPSPQSAGFVAAFQPMSTPVIVAGQATSDYGLLIGSIGGYATQITISCQGLPAGASCQVVPNPVNLPAGGVVAVSLVVSTLSTVPAGGYSFTAKLSDGTVTQTLSAAFNVGDFAMSLSPGAQTVGATDFTAFTLNIQGIDGYSQAIQVSCSGLPSGTACPFAATGPVYPGANYFQIHTQNAAAGTYTFTLTGTSNGIQRTATGQLTVTTGSFAGSVSPNAATIAVGASKSFSVQVNGSGGFQGQVNLTCSSASGVTCQLTPNQVTLASNGSASATLQVTVNSKPAITPFVFIGNLRKPREWTGFGLVLLFILTGYARRMRRAPAKRGAGNFRPAYVRPFVFSAVAVLVLSIASCGGGSSGGGSIGGGNGGGGVTGTSIVVTVQGNAGGTTATFGTVNVTIP